MTQGPFIYKVGSKAGIQSPLAHSLANMWKASLLLGTLLVSTSAAPSAFFEDEPVPRCSKECALTGIKKFGYESGKTYTYEYSGKSVVKLEGVPDEKTEMDWTIKADLTFVSPCDMVVQLRDPKVFGGQEDRIVKEQIVQHPMVVSISEGLVQDVCIHPKDNPTGLNIKKGIVSAIQNSLPSLSEIHSGKTYVETDVAGRCPTYYEVEKSSEETVVRKVKNYKECDERLGSPSESPATSWWLKTPLPLTSSNSTCLQKIKKGIVESTSCSDLNIVRPMVGMYKYIEAEQKSSLRLISQENKPKLSPLKEIKRTRIVFEYVNEPKTEEVVPAVKNLLKDICKKVEVGISEDTAKYVSKLTELLYRVPANEFLEIHSQIKKGEYCQKYDKLESIFLDVIAFVNNAGAAEIMVEQVIRGEAKEGRTLMYSLGLSLMRRPCNHTIKALIPLFKSEKNVPTPMVLAAGSLVNRYCKYSKCKEDEVVHEIYDILSEKISKKCSSSAESKEERYRAMEYLKALGNIGNMTQALEEKVLECVRSSRSAIPVRVAAAQAFRQCHCDKKFVQELRKVAVNSEEDTEVRIASYLAVIRCAKHDDVDAILRAITTEHNTQVRSFILSHLRNLQRSDAPFNKELKYMLSSFTVPTNYPSDFRMYSKNIDLSYYSSVLGLGAGVDTNLMYTPGSWIPRQINWNVTANILNNVFNVAEIGVRAEHVSEVLQSIIRSAERSLRKRQATKNEMSESLPHKEQELDAFLRMFEEELLFTSLRGNVKNIDVDSIVEKLLIFLERTLLFAQDSRVEFVRALRFDSDFFVPTIQGIPLMMKWESTTVVNLQMASKLELGKESRSVGIGGFIEISPGLSVESKGFIGYTMAAKAGLKAETTVHSDLQSKLKFDKRNNIEIDIDIPKKAELLTIKSEVHLIQKLPAKPDKNVSPKLSGESRLKKDGCLNSAKEAVGLDICWKVDVPSLEALKLLPIFEKSEIKITVEKVSKDSVVKLKAKHASEPTKSLFTVALLAPGAKTPEKGEFELELADVNRHRSIRAYAQVGKHKGSIKAELESQVAGERREYEASIYISSEKEISSSDKILSSKFAVILKGTEESIELELQTRNELRNYLRTTIEVHVDTSLEEYGSTHRRNISLRSLDVELGLPGRFSIKNQIRKTKTSSDAAKYDILSTATCGKDELYHVSGDITREGSYRHKNYHLKSDLSLKKSEKSFRISTEVVYKPDEMLAKIDVQNLRENSKVFYLEVSSLAKSPQDLDRSILLRLNIPKRSTDFKIIGRAHSTGSKSYKFDLKTMINGKPICIIDGEVAYEWTPPEKKLQCELVVMNLESNSTMEFKSRILLKSDRRLLELSLSRDRRKLISIHSQHQYRDEDYGFSYAIDLPTLVATKIDGEKTRQEMRLSGEASLMPSTDREKKVEGQVLVNTQNKKITIRGSGNFDRRTTKRAALDAKYDCSKERGYASLQGEATLDSKRYGAQLEIVIGAAAEPYSPKNKLKLQLVDLSQEKLHLDFELDYQSPERSRRQIRSLIELNTFTRSKYLLDSKVDCDYEKDKKFDLDFKADLKAPSLQQLSLTMDVKHRRHPYTEGAFKVSVFVQDNGAPVNASLGFHSLKDQFVNYSYDASYAGRKKYHSHGRITMEPKGSVKAIDIDSLTPSPSSGRDVMLQIHKSPSGKFDLLLETDGKKILSCSLDNSQERTWKMLVSVPERTEEGSVLDRRKEFEVLDRHTGKENLPYAARDKYEERRRHNAQSHIRKERSTAPEKERQMTVFAMMTRSSTRSAGVIELDIFKTPEDKMTASVEATCLESTSAKLDMSIKLPHKPNRPRLVLEGALSHRVKGLNITLHTEAASPPDAVLSLMDEKTSPDDHSLYALLKAGREKFEFSGKLKKHEAERCFGRSMNGTVTLPRSGSYDVFSSFCAPAYLELGARNSKSPDIYMIKAGMRDPAMAKLSVDKIKKNPHGQKLERLTKQELQADEPKRPTRTLSLYGRDEWLTKREIAMVGAKLWTPSLVSVDMKYDKKELKEFMERELRSAVEVAAEAKRDISRSLYEALEKSFHINSQKLARELEVIAKEAKEYASRLAEHVSRMVSLPQYSRISEKISEYIDEFARHSKALVEKAKDAAQVLVGERSYSSIWDVIRKIDRKIVEEVNSVTEKVRDWFEHFRHRSHESDVPDWWHKIVDWLESFPIWDELSRLWHNYVDFIRKEVHVVVDMAKKFYSTLKEDFCRAWDAFWNWGPIRKIVDWFEHWFDKYEIPENTQVLEKLARSFASFSIGENEGLVRVQVPLPRKANSLLEAVTSLILPSGSMFEPLLPLELRKTREALQHFNESMSRKVMDYMSPYERSAVLKHGKVITFDRTVIPFILSDCEIVLATSKDTSVKIVKDHQDRMTVHIATVGNEKVKITAGNSVQVEMNGRKVESFMKAKDVVIKKKESDVAEIDLKPFTVIIRKDSVEIKAKPEFFNKISGLMGSYDNEKSNDVPRGTDMKPLKQSTELTHEVSPALSRQVMQHWRSDKSCQIPPQ